MPPHTPVHRTPPGPNQTDYVTVRPRAADGTLGRPTTVERAQLVGSKPSNELDGGDIATFNGQQVEVGNNNIRITADGNGRPTNAQMDIRERFTTDQFRDTNTLDHQGKPSSRDGRISAERTAQRHAKTDGDWNSWTGHAEDFSWSGGHIGGHQFFPDLGRINMFPQELQLNTTGGYRQMEIAIERCVDGDIHVSAEVTLSPSEMGSLPGRQPVPPRIDVRVEFRGPNGYTVRYYDFNNAPNDMQAPHIEDYSGPDHAETILGFIGK